MNIPTLTEGTLIPSRPPTKQELKDRNADDVSQDTYWAFVSWGVARCRWCHQDIADDSCTCCAWNGTCGPFCGLKGAPGYVQCDERGGLVVRKRVVLP